VTESLDLFSRIYRQSPSPLQAVVSEFKVASILRV